MIVISGSLLLVSMAKVTEADEILVFNGLLTTEKCLKEPICLLEWFSDPDSLVLFTKKRTIYHLKTDGVPVWKFASGFGRQVAIKGTKEGGKIVVNDIIPLGGTGKISKSCL